MLGLFFYKILVSFTKQKRDCTAFDCILFVDRGEQSVIEEWRERRLR